MYRDVARETLHPFQQWAQTAAVCAFLLAAASFALLASSRRFSRRWWLGQGIFALCLLAIVFGARSRGASIDLLPVVVGCYESPGGSTSCDFVDVWVTPARQRAEILGDILLVVTALVVVATLAALALRWRRAGLGRRLPPVRVLGLLPVAITVAGYGAFQTANSVARWMATAYLDDMRNAGDDFGRLPLLYAIIGTLFGVSVLAMGLTLMVAWTSPGRERPQIGSPSPPDTT